MSPIKAKVNHNEAEPPCHDWVPWKSPEAEVVVEETVHDYLHASHFDSVREKKAYLA